jgi:hypothetical protein
MNRKQAKILIQRYEKEFSQDFHNQFTPFEICDEMLEKIEGLNSEMTILVMFNLEFIYTLSERFGKEGMKNVWFLTPCDVKKKVAMVMGVNENKVLTYSYNDRKIIGEENMPKFDVVVGNPPYLKDLHLKFLELAYKLSKRYIVWVHPSAWLIDEREKNNKIKELIKENIVNIKLFNGNPIFHVKFINPFLIEYIDKNYKNEGKIKIYDNINEKNIIFDSIYEVNKWMDDKTYPSLRDKIFELSKKNNLRKYRNNQYGPYIINIARIRGHIDYSDSKKMLKDDFYSPFPKNVKVEDKITQENWFSFKSFEKANNFMNFMKTRWGMFCFSILKIAMQSTAGSFESIPWLDWSEPWTEERFEKLINATSEEIEFVHKNIPDYYKR